MQKYPLDEQVQAFLDDAESYYPADNAALDIAENRERYLQLCDAYQAPIPKDIAKLDSTVSGRHGAIPIRQYLVNDVDTRKRVLYFHGGGFTVPYVSVPGVKSNGRYEGIVPSQTTKLPRGSF